jgi:hypothetical protein
MRIRKSLWLGLALGALLLPGAGARADMVSFVTTGTFDSGDLAGTNTYSDAANGISIVFNSSLGNNVTVPPESLVSFGQFDTSATTGTVSTPVVSGFTLDIFQTAPTAGMLTFVGALSGTLRIDNSGAHVDFAAPLSQSIGAIIYSIANADSGTPGRVNIAPPSTNGGLTSINGTVNAIPEPSALLLVALGGPALAVAAYRRSRR